MNMKHLFLGSVAALLTMSGAQAADAIVAAEPEPLEYVRVCDAFGTGYFYIPGTETCLSVGGYVRFEGRFGRDQAGTSDWSFWTRGQLEFSTKTDTELGTLTSHITLRSDAESQGDADTYVEEAYIELGGLRVGYQYSWWDDDLSGETDTIASNETVHNSIRYQYEGDSFTAGISLDELEEIYATKPGEGPNNLGIAAQLSGTFGPVTAYLLGGYDTDTSEGAIRGIVTAEVGPGELGIYGVWASGANYYYEESEWTVGGQYAWKATDKWTITPGVQYFSNIELDADGNGFSGGDAWGAGLTVDYQIVEHLEAKLSVQYEDRDGEDDQVFGFLRLQRNF